ncbi:ABC transporter permease [Patescibacteria group bacterium]|nr:ABC transporter permease [Patescibacteria group bacterium]MBU0964311.1 ABC transporter permease [Patescibacteria group bacterium]
MFLLLLFGLWYGLYYFKIWPAWLFPSPQQVWKTLLKGLANKTLIIGILISLKRIFIGFGSALLIGTILGFLIARIQILKETLGILLLGLQTLPSICWLPLALLWFGLNEKAIVFVVIIGAIFSITLSVQAAVLNVPIIYLQAGKILGAKKFTLYRRVVLPAIMPSYLTGIKQGWSFAWRSLMSGEMLFITVGLGQLLMFGRELNDMSQVLAVMLVIIFIGVFFDQLVFGFIDRQLKRRWGL